MSLSRGGSASTIVHTIAVSTQNRASTGSCSIMSYCRARSCHAVGMVVNPSCIRRMASCETLPQSLCNDLSSLPEMSMKKKIHCQLAFLPLLSTKYAVVLTHREAQEGHPSSKPSRRQPIPKLPFLVDRSSASCESSVHSPETLLQTRRAFHNRPKSSQ